MNHRRRCSRFLGLYIVLIRNLLPTYEAMNWCMEISRTRFLIELFYPRLVYSRQKVNGMYYAIRITHNLKRKLITGIYSLVTAQRPVSISWVSNARNVTTTHTAFIFLQCLQDVAWNIKFRNLITGFMGVFALRWKNNNGIGYTRIYYELNNFVWQPIYQPQFVQINYCVNLRVFYSHSNASESYFSI